MISTFDLQQALHQRIIVLDGAMGTMLQRYGFDGKDGYDILSLTHPDIVCDIHRQYLEAGADIISTNTFCAGLSGRVTEISTAAARIARLEADRYMQAHPGRQIFVAGTIGPSDHPQEQINALIKGGCDILLFETVYDAALLVKSLTTAQSLAVETGKHIPIMVSATVDVRTGCIHTGESIETLWHSISYFADVISFGLNCSSGASLMKPYISEIASICDRFVSCHPCAGLRDKDGNYDENADNFAANMEAMLKDRTLNIVGGCCGTTPGHIRALSRIAALYQPLEKR